MAAGRMYRAESCERLCGRNDTMLGRMFRIAVSVVDEEDKPSLAPRYEPSKGQAGCGDIPRIWNTWR